MSVISCFSTLKYLIMDKDRKKKRKRINPGASGKSNYGNRGGRGTFHPDTEEENPGGTGSDSEIDYEDLEDRWYEIQDGYRDRYPHLTDSDVTVEPAHFDRTIDRIGRRTERSPAEVRNEIENW